MGKQTNLKSTVLELVSGKYSSKSGTSIRIKCGPSGSNPDCAMAGSKAKIFSTTTALIFMSLEMDAELEDVPTLTLSPSVIFL